MKCLVQTWLDDLTLPVKGSGINIFFKRMSLRWLCFKSSLRIIALSISKKKLGIF